MGSCSFKSTSNQNNPIQVLPPTPLIFRAADNDAQSSPAKLKIPSAPTAEETHPRRKNKKLTVLTTNDDEFTLPKDLEFSFVKRQSLGKEEQGSLLISKPVQFGGRIADTPQLEFEDKLLLIEGLDVKSDYLLDHGIWVACKKGLKPQMPNQDDFVVFLEENSSLLGVFDGHGTHGHEISNFVHRMFPEVLAGSDAWDSDPTRAISEAFFQVHNALVSHCSRNLAVFDCSLSGTTATVICVRAGTLHIGHVGDSRAVLGRREAGKVVAVPLTRDHKPTLDDEIERITRMGGEVKRLDDDVPYRVFCRGKFYPGIAMSRSIGDLLAQTVGVTCSPEINEQKIEKEDEFVLICSDGVWEFISSQEAVDVVSRNGLDLRSAAEKLATLAWEKWVENEGDVVDDITVLLARLNSIN
jgi:serine/threonine protein phosphatase PrpC